MCSNYGDAISLYKPFICPLQYLGLLPFQLTNEDNGKPSVYQRCALFLSSIVVLSATIFLGYYMMVAGLLSSGSGKLDSSTYALILFCGMLLVVNGTYFWPKSVSYY
jgi:hypothetical protein